ncbi:MAG TPA: thiamine pyrophosphate-dependent enzyme, partial [Ktedonobacterales bacterium]|nr:thiamine pyrophosphate-dependent enzyme [Ktedonobacterales bacterium]
RGKPGARSRCALRGRAQRRHRRYRLAQQAQHPARLAPRPAQAGFAAERARKGEGPTLVESVTYRFRGHSLADPAYYRTRDEENHWRSTRDPIALFEAKLKEHDIITDEVINASVERADAVVEEAAQFAEESPEPSPDALYEDVLSDGTGAIAWRNKPSTPRD